MNKLVISEEAFKKLEETGNAPQYFRDVKCLYSTWRGPGVSKFKSLLHKLVEVYDFEDKEAINEEISNNNFTSCLMRGLLEIKEI